MASTPANKTRPTDADVEAYLAGVTPLQRQQDSRDLAALLTEISGEPAAMWGPSIIGFGRYRYHYESGRQGEAPAVSFAPRAGKVVVYFPEGVSRHEDLLDRLGPHTIGKGCLNLKRLSDIDLEVLTEMVRRSFVYLTSRPDGMHRAQ